MPEKSLEHKDIVQLLAKLKEETPEYPAELVKSRKESFLKQVLDTSLSGEGKDDGNGGDNEGQGPKGASGSSDSSGVGKSGKPSKPGDASGMGGSSKPGGLGGSGSFSGPKTGLSRGTTGLGLGISLKSAFVFGAVILLLTAAYLFRDQIAEYLAGNEIVRTQETAAPSIADSSASQATETLRVASAPNAGTPSSEIVVTGTAPGFGDNAQSNGGGLPITGSGPSSTQGIPESSSSRVTKTPTPPAQRSPASAIEFLICILRSGGESCK